MLYNLHVFVVRFVALKTFICLPVQNLCLIFRLKVLKTFCHLQMIDGLFDIMNSRSPFGQKLKQPITKRNWTETEKYLNEAREFLMSLMTTKGQLLCKSPR